MSPPLAPVTRNIPNYTLRRCAWCGRPLRWLNYVGDNGPFGPVCAQRFAAAQEEQKRARTGAVSFVDLTHPPA